MNRPSWLRPAVFQRQFSTSAVRSLLQKQTRCRVVDNSKIGQEAMALRKPPKIIHVYTKNGKGTLGDRVLVTVLGEKKKGYILGVRKQSWDHGIPRHDTNNIALVDDTGNPLGTRITAPFPTMLRGSQKAIVAPGGPRGGGADASFSPNPRSASTFTCSRRRGQLSRDYIEPFASAAAANRVEALSESVQQDLAKVSEECRSDMKKVFREVLRVQTTVDAAVNFYTQYLFQREPAVRSFFGYNDDTDLQQLAFKSYDFSSFVTSVMSHIRGLTESLDDPAVFELFVKKIGRVHALVTCLSKPWMYYYGECLLEFVKHIVLDPNAPASDEESNNFKRTENAFRQIWYLIVEHAWRWTELERDALAKQDEERERKQQQQQQQNRSPSPQQQSNANNNNIPITVTPSATLLKPMSSNTAMPRESTI